MLCVGTHNDPRHGQHEDMAWSGQVGILIGTVATCTNVHLLTAASHRINMCLYDCTILEPLRQQVLTAPGWFSSLASCY